MLKEKCTQSSAFFTFWIKKLHPDECSFNITLLVRDDNTATLKWGNSEGKDYKIDGDRFIALAGDEEGKITYKNGKIKIELADGDYLAFKK